MTDGKLTSRKRRKITPTVTNPIEIISLVSSDSDSDSNSNSRTGKRRLRFTSRTPPPIEIKNESVTDYSSDENLDQNDFYKDDIEFKEGIDNTRNNNTKKTKKTRKSAQVKENTANKSKATSRKSSSENTLSNGKAKTTKRAKKNPTPPSKSVTKNTDDKIDKTGTNDKAAKPNGKSSEKDTTTKAKVILQPKPKGRGRGRPPKPKVEAYTLIKQPTDNSDPVVPKKRISRKKTPAEHIDPSDMSYAPRIITDEDDEILKQNMINKPAHAFFYYQYLGDQLGFIFKFMMNKKEMHLQANRERFLVLQDWDEFVNTYSFIREDKEVWRDAGPTLDMPLLVQNTILYRRVLVDLMNCIYDGYTKSKALADLEMSQRLITIAGNRKKDNYTKDLNIQYHKLLSKEFSEFFELRTGFGNDMFNFVKKGSIYVTNDNKISNEFIPRSTKWTSDEKDIFYESLARYGISKLDSISPLLPNKSDSDIMNFYDTLSLQLKQHKSDKKLRKKLLTLEEIPIAYEMSEPYIELEEKLSKCIEKLDEEQFGNFTGEYYGPYRDQILKKCLDVFDTMNIQRFLKILNGLNAHNEEFSTENIVESVLLEMYNLMYEYTYELMFRLLKRQLNELTIAQQYEFNNLVKMMTPPPDPKSMVHILDLDNIDEEVIENIDYFDEPESDDSDADSEYDDDFHDGENDFFPEFKSKQLGLMKVNPAGLVIVDRYDIWNLGITSKQVYEESDKLFKEYNCSNKLWMMFAGKLNANWKVLLNKQGNPEDINGDDEEEEEEEDNDDEKPSGSLNKDNDDRDDDDDDDDDDNSDDDNDNNGSEDDNTELDGENYDFLDMLTNAQDIDDLQSEDEFHHLAVNNVDGSNDKENELENEYEWYDDEFIVLDGNIQAVEKGLENSKYATGIDLTTKGHEYLQKLCDDEQSRVNKKDVDDSVKHENLLLTQLGSDNKSDDLNDKYYATLFAQLKYGGAKISKNSWDSAFGGPAAMIADLNVKNNVKELVNETDMIFGLHSQKVNVDPKDAEEFRHTFNNYD